MKRLRLHRIAGTRAAPLLCVLLLGACQATQHRSLELAMPEAASQQQYAYLIEAVDAFESALLTERPQFGGIVFGERVVASIPALMQGPDRDPQDIIRAVAAREIADAGPYRLLHADTAIGRLEFTSASGADHLAVFVGPASETDAPSTPGFQVVEMYAQTALTDRLQQGIETSDTRMPANTTLGALRINAVAGTDDAARLAHFDGLPASERDRDDILARRAVLATRLDRRKLANELVQHGLIRYPDSPVYYALASRLLEQASAEPDQPDDQAIRQARSALSLIMAERFDRRARADSERSVSEALSVRR